jgi:STE24 endopeptidase
MIQFNALMILFLAAFVSVALLRRLLTAVNIRHLHRHGHEVPEAFAGEIDGETLTKMSRYTAESSKFGILEGFFDDLVTLAILLSGFLPWLTGHILPWKAHFVASGLMFFMVLFLISFLLGVPFSLYQTFVIEKKYGFSTVTPALWISDLLKNLLISTILLVILLGAFLALMHYAEKTWWLWAWMVFASFQLLMLWLYPVVIAPLFNKYEPVRDETLKEAIVDMMAKAGLKTEGVYQVDEGKRSRHTNAYFTGIGKTKRIVLYDTLLTSHSRDEILAILAHEIGHWKKKHILMQLAFMETASLAAFYIIYRIIDWPLPYQTFGFDQPIPYAGLLLLAALFGPFTFFLTPLGTAVLRKFERDADHYSYALTGSTQALRSALKRLAKDNLANLHPHPLYAWFYYSHPPLTERIMNLRDMETHQKAP